MNQHAIETYKSLVTITLDGLKLLALLNGGAAVALLLGNVAGKGGYVIPMRESMVCYVIGLVLCGVAYFASYVTQLNLFNESLERPGALPHTWTLYAAMILCLLSFAAFVAG